MVLMGTTDCVYYKLIEELYKLDYQKDLWYFNAGELPQYALLDQYPGIAVMADEGVHYGRPHKIHFAVLFAFSYSDITVY